MATLDIERPTTCAEARTSGRRTTLRLVAVIFLLAVVVRVAYCMLLIAPGRGPTVHGNDDWQYDYYATRLLSGRGISHANGQPTAQRTPGYPLLLAGVYGIFGHSYLAARLVQCVLGGASCLLLYLLAGRWVSRRAGLIAAGVLAVYPMHIWLSGVFLSENLTVPGVLLMLLALSWARRSARIGKWLLAGLVAGGVGLVHPIVAGLGVVLVGGVAISSVLAGQRRWRSALVMTAALALPLVGWMVRNRIAVGSFALSSLSGTTFHGANNIITATRPRYYGYWVAERAVPGTWQQISEVHDEMARSRLLWQLGLRWLRDHPHYWPRLVACKLVRFYGPLLDEWRSPKGLLYLASYGALLPLVIAGFWGAWRRRWSVDATAFRLVVVTMAYYTVVVIVFWGAPRFRLTIEPLLITLAAATIVRLTDRLRRWEPNHLPIPRWQLQGDNV